MLRITENQDEIILRELPVIRWTISSVIIFTIFLLTFIDFSFNKKSLFDLAGVLLISLPIVSFLFYLLTYPATTTKINRKDQFISIRKQSLFKYTFNVYSFNQINGLICIEEFGFLNGVTNYQLVLSLQGDVKIELSVSAYVYKEPLNDTADLMNSYIRNRLTYGP
jgi:hypothetical protein